MRGVLALDALRMISTKVVRMRKKMRLFFIYCAHARQLVGGEETGAKENVDELSCIVIGSLSLFIGNSEWFLM